MLRRGLGVAALLLVFAAPAQGAGTLGLAEVRSADGTLIGKAGAGAYAYPADGSVLRVGSSRAKAARVELRNISMFNGRVTVRRLVVPARGLAGASVQGLVVDGTSYVVGPNALIPLDGGSYIVALQEAVSPGVDRLRPGRAAGVRLGPVARPRARDAAARRTCTRGAPDSSTSKAAAVLGLPQLPAAQASLAGVPTFLEPNILPPANTLGGPGGRARLSLSRRPLRVGWRLTVGLRLLGPDHVRVRATGNQARALHGLSVLRGPTCDARPAQPGDLVFFHANSAGVPQHEGMYIGNGSFIHAPQTGDVVKISSLFETRYALAYSVQCARTRQEVP